MASLAGSITSTLSKVDRLSDIFLYLARTLPPQSIFFIQLTLISTVLGLGSELLRTTALVQAAFRQRLGPRLTAEDRQAPFCGLRPLGNPRFFLHAQVLANTTLHFMILYTFTVLSPIVSYVLLFSFLCSEVGYRHQFIYIYPPTLDSGGQIWIKFTTITMVCMTVAEVILLTYMGLARAGKQLFMMIPLVAITILFNVYIRQRHFTVARHLSSETCVKVDDARHDANEGNDFMKDEYLQPALRGFEADQVAPRMDPEMAKKLFDATSA